MSQRKRIVLVAAALVVVFAVVPAPSQAAFRGEGPSILAAWEKAWVWVARQIGRGELWQKEGGAIDPNGSPKPGSAPPPQDTSTADEGSAINPDGAP